MYMLHKQLPQLQPLLLHRLPTWFTTLPSLPFYTVSTLGANSERKDKYCCKHPLADD